MKVTIIEEGSKLSRALEYWMDYISSDDLDTFFEILENQQIYKLHQIDQKPKFIRNSIRAIAAIRQQLVHIKTKSKTK